MTLINCVLIAEHYESENSHSQLINLDKLRELQANGVQEVNIFLQRIEEALAAQNQSICFNVYSEGGLQHLYGVERELSEVFTIDFPADVHVVNYISYYMQE